MARGISLLQAAGAVYEAVQAFRKGNYTVAGVQAALAVLFASRGLGYSACFNTAPLAAPGTPLWGSAPCAQTVETTNENTATNAPETASSTTAQPPSQ